MAETNWTGPLKVGTRATGNPNGVNQGLVVLSQTVLIGFDATLVQTASINLPANAQIVNILPDVQTVYDSATSAVLSVGSAAAGTQYAGSVDVKTAAGRITPAYTGAQLLAMSNITTNTAVYATVTSVGQPTAGSVRVTFLYVQN